MAPRRRWCSRGDARGGGSDGGVDLALGTVDCRRERALIAGGFLYGEEADVLDAQKTQHEPQVGREEVGRGKRLVLTIAARAVDADDVGLTGGDQTGEG